MSRCAHCPVDPHLRCRGQSATGARWCQRAAGDPLAVVRASGHQIPPGPPAAVVGAPGGSDRLVAPFGCLDIPNPHASPDGPWPHQGRIAVKPWERRVTCTFAHLNTPDLVPLVVGLLRLQTERPYIVIVDTGSDRATLDALEAHRAEDVEIHHVRAHAWHHSSEPVSAACDVATALCKTEYLFFTHADVFLRRRDVLKEFLERCTPSNPVVGYRMTERSHVTSEWTWMVGHTALMVHVPTIRRAGVQWGYGWGRDCGVRPAGEIYFDTETEFNWGCRREGLAIDCSMGDEQNYRRNVNRHFDHPRSYASSRLYANGDADYRAAKDGWMDAARAEAAARIEAWTRRDCKPRVEKGNKPTPAPGGR